MALPHLPQMRRKLVGLGSLFRRQSAVEFGERLLAHGRYLALQAGFLGAQLVDPGGVVRPDRLEHPSANLFQLLADGLSGLAHILRLGFGPSLLRRGQIQVARDTRAARATTVFLDGRLRRWAAYLLRGQDQTSRYRRCCCKTQPSIFHDVAFSPVSRLGAACKAGLCGV
jgi:hypothetical protein